MIRSPKIRFHDRVADVSFLGELVAKPEFQYAIDAAMCQYLHEMPMVKDAHGSMAMAHRIEGANEFKKVLFQLADKPDVSKPRTSMANLEGNVRQEQK